LKFVLAELKRNEIPFVAVELESLTERPVIQDLLSITRALLHPADRLAWLSLLRSPLCGLMLSQMHELFENDDRAVPTILNEKLLTMNLDSETSRRLQRFTGVMFAAMELRGRINLRSWVETTWLQLGGPSCVASQELIDVQMYLDELDAIEADEDIPDPDRLQAVLDNLRAQPASEHITAEAVQVMTIHKAKGLEFDVVILPGLSRTPPVEQSPLLSWSRRSAGTHADDVLLAPVHATGDESDPVQQFLMKLEKLKREQETSRLLYVAVTRARHSLHLTGHAKPNKKGDDLIRPRHDTFLARLWPTVVDNFAAEMACHKQAEGSSALSDYGPMVLQRLPVDYTAATPDPDVKWHGSEQPSITEIELAIEFEWVGDIARHVGSVVHRYMKMIADEGLSCWNSTRILGSRQVIEQMLYQLGVPDRNLSSAASRVIDVLLVLLDDERAHWLLSQEHQDARNEYELTGFYRDKVINVVLDRTFVDDNGVRWIIDYKTSSHEGADIDSFLDNEVDRYRAQLERYASLIQYSDDRPIKLGLYFPLLRGWREWAYKFREQGNPA
jgi:ATP-dependent exoDNAse (exonuclease V) beta subunit